MSQDQVPKFPNWPGAAGSTGPVVTTLLAGIALGLSVAGLDIPGACSLHFWPLAPVSCATAVAAFGFSAVALFVLATMNLVWAQASDVTSWDNARIQWLYRAWNVIDQTGQLSEAAADTYRTKSMFEVQPYVERASDHILSGICLATLASSALTWPRSYWLALVLTVLGLIASVWGVTDKRTRKGAMITLALAIWLGAYQTSHLWEVIWP